MAAESKSLKDDQKEEPPTQDNCEEKQDDSATTETKHVKEDQTLPNGEVPQEEDEGVDLRGIEFCLLYTQEKVFLALAILGKRIYRTAIAQ